MDYLDIQQETETETSTRLMSVKTSLEQAQLATKHTRTFEEKTVTEQQLRDEMTYTYVNCSSCTLKEINNENTN